jgi:hypothetical protein
LFTTGTSRIVAMARPADNEGTDMTETTPHRSSWKPVFQDVETAYTDYARAAAATGASNPGSLR